MNNEVELTIGGGAPWRYASGKLHIPGLTIRSGTPWELRSSGRRWSLIHVRPEEGPRDPREFTKFAARAAKDGLPLVLGPYLRRDIRSALEQEGISYFDFYGNVHLVAPGVLVHVQTPTEQPTARALGPAGRRAAQCMLEGLGRSWAVTELASEARISAGQAHAVIKLAEAGDLLVTEGRGPQKRRRINEPSRFLDWLASHEPKRPPIQKLEATMYARSPGDLLLRLHAGSIGATHAVTGSAAAAWVGVGPTSVTTTVVRVDPGTPLPDFAARVGAEPTSRGANILFWADEGLVATPFARQERGVSVAPNVRVYLDLLKEQRGQDIAAVFRDQILGY